MKPTILIVDDEKNTREGLRKALESHDHRILLAASTPEALRIMEQERIDLLLTDLRMPGEDGLELMRRGRMLHPEASVILLTAYGTVQTAVRAMKEGAYDYLTKPVDLNELGMVVERALASRKKEYGEGSARYGIENVTGTSGVLEEIKGVVRRIAPTKATVLIEGESGTGKELIARAIHGLSDRRDQPFVAVHCAALAESLLESELFGHEKGAFTGALKQRLGRFEMANGGTLFLDEVSEMAVGTQVKLLRVLQEQEFERVGGSETVHVDVRLIAATNANLESLIAQGRFREDLYYRLNVIRLRVPPLREREGDIPLLVNAFLAEFDAENGKQVRGLTPEAMAAMQAYEWPGNVRELRNCIEGLVVLSRGDTISLSELPSKMRESIPHVPETSEGTLKASELRMIEEALAKTNGRKSDAANLLGISRRTLHRKIKQYGIS
ncbi:MAG: sigma-54 dependent transcriptional regulator [bacterium]